MRKSYKEFWEIESVIKTPNNSVTNVSMHEKYLYSKVNEYFQKDKITNIVTKIFGCGTGREILAIYNELGNHKINASDISQSMINFCEKNVIEWGIDKDINLSVEDLISFENMKEEFNLVMLMNGVLTYITKKDDRHNIFKKIFNILGNKGCVIGVVHNQVGTPKKTIYFKLKSLLRFIPNFDSGNRMTGFEGFKVRGHYFTKSELHSIISKAGFKDIEILSLEELRQQMGLNYNRNTGSNNLIFMAKK